MVLLWKIIEGCFRLSFCDSNVWLHWSQFLFVDWISSNAIILIVSFFSFWSLSKKSKGSLDWRSVTLFLTASFSNLECYFNVIFTLILFFFVTVLTECCEFAPSITSLVVTDWGFHKHVDCNYLSNTIR